MMILICRPWIGTGHSRRLGIGNKHCQHAAVLTLICDAWYGDRHHIEFGRLAHVGVDRVRAAPPHSQSHNEKGHASVASFRQQWAYAFQSGTVVFCGAHFQA